MKTAGGQGLNLGIRDAAALAQVLQTAVERGEDLGDLRVLRRYERWRKRENLTIIALYLKYATLLRVRCVDLFTSNCTTDAA